MPTVFNDNGTWLIVRNLRQVDASGISGTRSRSANRVRHVYECWTGKDWSHQRHFGLKFDSEAEATQHLNEKRETIESTE